MKAQFTKDACLTPDFCLEIKASNKQEAILLSSLFQEIKETGDLEIATTENLNKEITSVLIYKLQP